MHHLFKNADVRLSSGHSAAGTTLVSGTPVDTFGYDGVAFVIQYGTLTATQVTSAKLQGGNLANGSDLADLAGSHTAPLLDTQSNLIQVIDVYRPGQRYLAPVVVRGTANAEVLGITAILYHAELSPPPATDATVASPFVFLIQAVPGTA